MQVFKLNPTQGQTGRLRKSKNASKKEKYVTYKEKYPC